MGCANCTDSRDWGANDHCVAGRVVGMAGALDGLARACGSLLAGLLIGRTKLVVLLDVQSSIYLACAALAFVFLMRRAQGSQRADEGGCSTIVP